MRWYWRCWAWGSRKRMSGERAWKSFDWDAMDRLHAKGYISDPKSKAKSVVLNLDGVKRARELFERHFARS
jgi:hypothetical protein